MKPNSFDTRHTTINIAFLSYIVIVCQHQTLKFESTPVQEGNFTTRGYLELEMKAVMAADNITLHMADIDLDKGSVSVMEEGGGNVRINR